MVAHCLVCYSLNTKEISVWTSSSHCVVSLRKTLSSHVAPVHPGVQKGTGELSEKSNKTRKEGEGVHFSMSKTTAGQRKFNSNITLKEGGSDGEDDNARLLLFTPKREKKNSHDRKI